MSRLFFPGREIDKFVFLIVWLDLPQRLARVKNLSRARYRIAKRIVLGCLSESERAAAFQEVARFSQDFELPRFSQTCPFFDFVLMHVRTCCYDSILVDFGFL